ncbi:MAG: hypothetical protein AB2689_28080 [Candidatus Thiodiazotropha taylori]
MGLKLPQSVPLNWYQYDVSFSIELMKGYIESVEKQVDESISRYKEEKEEVVLEEIQEEGYVRAVEYFRGLDDETWDLDGIFGEYFPSLQRRSALVTLFSFFENELNRLCNLYQSHKAIKVSFKDLNGQGIDRAVLYLDKAVDLNVQKQSAEWAEIKNIQKVRNLIIHLDGNLISIDGKPKKDEQNYVKQHQNLNGEKEIVILDGYLQHVLNTIHKYFKMLSVEIERKENA